MVGIVEGMVMRIAEGSCGFGTMVVTRFWYIRVCLIPFLSLRAEINHCKAKLIPLGETPKFASDQVLSSSA